MSSIQSLPQELVDRILDEFGSLPIGEESYRTLLACAHVSKSFNARARQLLVKDIKLTDGTSRKVSALCSNLLSTPGLSSHMRSLRLSFNTWVSDTTYIEGILNIMKDHAINLEHLDIFCDNEDLTESLRFTEDLRSSLHQLGQCSSLTMLHVKFFDIPIASLVQFVNLKTLILERCSFSHSTQINPEAFENLEELHIIRCVERFCEIFLFQLPKQPGQRFKFRRLKTLSCLFRQSSDINHIWVLLADPGAGSVLENLELVEETLFYQFSPIYPNLFDLSKLKQLRHFKLKSILANPYGRFIGTTASRLLSSAAVHGPTTIQSISVALDTTFSLQLPLFLRKNDNWRSLDLDLTDGFIYPSLRTVDFSLHLRPGQDESLTVEKAKNFLGPELQFPTLRNSPLIALNVNFTVGPSLFTS